MWVTEDEHRRAAGDNCDGKQLAAWSAADVPGRRSPPVPVNFPRSRRLLLRQLAAHAVNNLSQIARQVNAGGGQRNRPRTGCSASLMAIDAGLERLRRAVLEKGADDDR